MNYEITPAIFGVLVTQILKPNGSLNELRFRIADESKMLGHGDTIITMYNRVAAEVVAVAQPEEDMPPVYWARSSNPIVFMTDMARHQIEEIPVAVATRVYNEMPEPERVLIDATVFPSTEQSIVCIVTDEKFNGAHDYEIKPMLRFQPEWNYDAEAIEALFRAEQRFLFFTDLVEVHQGKSPSTPELSEMIKKCVELGYIKQTGGHTVYGLEGMPITFVKRLADGSFRPGIQTEQLLLTILDRHPKLNAEFPAPGDVHERFMGHIQAALDCLGERFKERMDRGVAGDHKK